MVPNRRIIGSITCCRTALHEGGQVLRLEAGRVPLFRRHAVGVGVEVRDFTEGGGSQVIELISDLPFPVVVGDKLRLFPGCDKTNPICISKFNSGITFVGEYYVPGEDVLGQYPDAR